MGRELNPADILGTAEHAALLTSGRHPGVVTAMAWLAFSHLPDPLKEAARPFYQSGCELITVISDSAELTIALNTLVESKDWAVRALIRHQQGRPGPVPRPAEVVDPPVADNRIGPNFGRPLEERGNYGPGQPRPIKDNPQA